MCNSDHILKTLDQFVEQSQTAPLSLGEAFDALNQSSYALIAFILVLPFLQPLPLGPFTVLGSIAFIVLGWQLFKGHVSPVLPQKIRQIPFSNDTWRKLNSVCKKVLSICKKFTKPRYQSIVNGRRGEKVGGFILLASGALMVIPFGVLPFNNMLPGLAILFYAIGELEDDGVMWFIAFFWLIVTVLYFSAFFFALYFFGQETLNFFK